MIRPSARDFIYPNFFFKKNGIVYNNIMYNLCIRVYICEIMSERDFVYPKIKDVLLSQDLHVAFLLYS